MKKLQILASRLTKLVREWKIAFDSDESEALPTQSNRLYRPEQHIITLAHRLS